MKRLFALVKYLGVLMFPPAPPLLSNTDDRVLDWLTEDFEIN